MEHVIGSNQTRVLASLAALDPIQGDLSHAQPSKPSGFATLVIAIKSHFKRQAAIRELQALSDWQLKDIGISRYDIPSMVKSLIQAS